MTEKTPVKCHLCGYEWLTGSDMKKISCPCCGGKTHNPRWKETR